MYIIVYIYNITYIYIHTYTRSPEHSIMSPHWFNPQSTKCSDRLFPSRRSLGWLGIRLAWN